MLGIEEQLLSASITDTIQRASAKAYDLFHLENVLLPEEQEALGEDEGVAATQETLSLLIEKCFRDIAVLAERLGLKNYCKKVNARRASFESLSDLTASRYGPVDESLPLTAAREMFDSLMTMTNGRSVSGLGVFENILASTANIIDLFGDDPTKEVDVRRRVIEILKISFRDVVSEIPLATPLKSYKPDIGVVSLMAAAEYKFIGSLDEAKRSLDEIYTDMRGYSGRIDWRSFYAVFYMTSQFYTQDQVVDQFRILRADLSWKPIVVVGKGGRRP